MNKRYSTLGPTTSAVTIHSFHYVTLTSHPTTPSARLAPHRPSQFLDELDAVVVDAAEPPARLPDAEPAFDLGRWARQAGLHWAGLGEPAHAGQVAWSVAGAV